MNCWTFGTCGLQQNAVDSATDGQRVFAPEDAPAYGSKEDILSLGNMLTESAVTSTEAMFQIRRMCVSNILTMHKLMIKVCYDHQEFVQQ